MGHVLPVLTVVLTVTAMTCGHAIVFPDSDQPSSLTVSSRTGAGARDPNAVVFADRDQPSSLTVSSRTGAGARDPNAVVFADSEDSFGGDSQPGTISPVGRDFQPVTVSPVGRDFDHVTVTDTSPVSNDSDAVVIETVRPSVVNSSVPCSCADTAVVKDTAQSSISYSSVSNYSVTVVVEIVANTSVTPGVTEAVNNNDYVYYDEDDVIPDEYRVKGHNDSFAERNGLIMRAAIVAPRRRSNKGRMVGGVYRTPV